MKKKWQILWGGSFLDYLSREIPADGGRRLLKTQRTKIYNQSRCGLEAACSPQRVGEPLCKNIV
jgi:hypothetical protein